MVRRQLAPGYPLKGLFITLALMTPTAACAQEMTPDNPLYGIPVPVHARSPSIEDQSVSAICDSGVYGVATRETRVTGDDIKRVSLEAFSTPQGALSAGDLRQVTEALGPFWMISGLGVECWPNGAAIVFRGRKRSEPENSTLVVWIREGHVTRIDGYTSD